MLGWRREDGSPLACSRAKLAWPGASGDTRPGHWVTEGTHAVAYESGGYEGGGIESMDMGRSCCD